MKTRKQIFDLLTSNEPVTVEEFLSYEKSLRILLIDYYCTDEIFCVYLGGYGTVFYIPERDIFEECMHVYMQSVKAYDEEEYNEFQYNWLSLSVGVLPTFHTQQ